VLVGDPHLLFQRIELRFVVDLPPFAAGRSVAGLGLFPARGRLGITRREFLICGGDWRGGPLIVRSYRAARGEEQRAEYRQGQNGRRSTKPDPGMLPVRNFVLESQLPTSSACASARLDVQRGRRASQCGKTRRREGRCSTPRAAPVLRRSRSRCPPVTAGKR